MVSCWKWSVVSCQLSVVGRTEEEARLTTVVRTGDVEPRAAVRALRGSGSRRGLRTGVPFEPRTDRAWSRGFRETVIPAKDPLGDALG